MTAPTFLLQNSQDNPKFKELYDKMETHREVSDSVISRIRAGTHVFIQRRTTLLYLLKKEYQKSNRCDFTLGKK